MVATAILDKEEVLELLNRSNDCHHILHTRNIGDKFYDELVKHNISTKSKMAATVQPIVNIFDGNVDL